MKTVIMAGGKGTRISSLFPNIPKPLIPISNGTYTKPVLEWEIENLRQQGFTDIILTLGYMGDKIKRHFGNGKKFDVHIESFIEDKPLGNAGMLFRLRHLFTEDFLLLNADSVFDIDFNRFIEFHRSHSGLVTLFTHPNNHPYDSGLVVADKDSSVKQLLTKEDERPKFYKNCINAGLHIVNPAIFSIFKIDSDMIGKEVHGRVLKVDLDRQILKPLCGTRKMFVYNSPEYVKDMGTPERYKQVSHDFLSGIVTTKKLSHPQKAIFLDRDGTINKYVGFLRKTENVELLPGAAKAIKKINESGYLAIVVTNQPVIARGEVSYLELDEIHNKMETLLGLEGAYIDGLYYCPHHPHKGYKGEISELKINCNCRKPRPGMLIKASKDFNINLSESWMIGDGENDLKAGKNAGCHTALIGTEDYGQEITVKSLLEAVEKILGK